MSHNILGEAHREQRLIYRQAQNNPLDAFSMRKDSPDAQTVYQETSNELKELWQSVEDKPIELDEGKKNKISSLIERLGNNDYEVRESAEAEIVDILKESYKQDFAFSRTRNGNAGSIQRFLLNAQAAHAHDREIVGRLEMLASVDLAREVATDEVPEHLREAISSLQEGDITEQVLELYESRQKFQKIKRMLLDSRYDQRVANLVSVLQELELKE